MIKKILLIIILLLFVIVGLPIATILFYLNVLQCSCIYGKNISRELAISSIDRGPFVLPNGINNITFYLIGRTNSRARLYFKGEIKYDDFNDWCKKMEIKLNKRNDIRLSEQMVDFLKLKTDIIEIGYKELYQDVAYDEKTKTCYVMCHGIGPPRSLSESEWKKIAYFPYLTSYWRDVEVKEPIRGQGVTQ